jgi:hypothetical protein
MSKSAQSGYGKTHTGEYPIDGAVHRVGKANTAWNERHATWCMVIAGVDANPQKAGELTRWAKEYWQTVQPSSKNGGGYVNFLMDDGDERCLNVRENYDRLVALKGNTARRTSSASIRLSSRRVFQPGGEAQFFSVAHVNRVVRTQRRADPRTWLAGRTQDRPLSR